MTAKWKKPNSLCLSGLAPGFVALPEIGAFAYPQR